MLTLLQLKAMPPFTRFATGITVNPRLHKQEVRWVAERGEIHDWTIYYHFSNRSIDAVSREGDKVFTPELIRELVPCDDEAFGWYRG
jgi:hypothetical protein